MIYLALLSAAFVGVVAGFTTATMICGATHARRCEYCLERRKAECIGCRQIH